MSKHINIRNRLGFYWSVLNKDMVSRAELDYGTFIKTRDALGTCVGDFSDKTLLDIGCGRLCTQTLLFHSLAGKVTGIDRTYMGVSDPPIIKYWRSLATNGLSGFARDFLYSVLGKNRLYLRRLSSLSGSELNPGNLDIRQMDVQSMSFPDSVFDIAISNAVFEHIPDVPRAVSELHRVLKKGAVIYITIHLFTSISGGHCPWRQDFRRIPPWDHLRANSCAVPVSLNKLREREYISLFREKFEILDIIDGDYVGEDLLTASISTELSDYSTEELLKEVVTIIGRK